VNSVVRMTLPALLPTPSSPVADAYARLAEVHPRLRVQELDPAEPIPAGEGWIRGDELAAGGAALDAFLAGESERIVRDYGRQGRPDVVATLGLHRYAWPACVLFTAPWFLARRVPRVAASGTAFHPSGRMTVRISGFACLPGDPAARLPGARVVPDEEALRAEVREAVAEHLGPVLDGFAPRLRRGRRALWGMATDEVVDSSWYIGRLLGEPDRVRQELEQLLPGTAKPYVGTPGFRTLTGPSGEQLPTRDRSSCCLFYTIRPEGTCVTCPRMCDGDRVARLLPGN
jgi:hypothetical protein